MRTPRGTASPGISRREEFDQSLLVTGPNTITLKALTDTGVTYDVVYIDYAELEFANTFTTTVDALSFSYDVTETLDYVIGGFAIFRHRRV